MANNNFDSIKLLHYFVDDTVVDVLRTSYIENIFAIEINRAEKQIKRKYKKINIIQAMVIVRFETKNAIAKSREMLNESNINNVIADKHDLFREKLAQKVFDISFKKTEKKIIDFIINKLKIELNKKMYKSLEQISGVAQYFKEVSNNLGIDNHNISKIIDNIVNRKILKINKKNSKVSQIQVDQGRDVIKTLHSREVVKYEHIIDFCS